MMVVARSTFDCPEINTTRAPGSPSQTVPGNLFTSFVKCVSLILIFPVWIEWQPKMNPSKSKSHDQINLRNDKDSFLSWRN